MPVSENARAVLEKRYLLRDAEGRPLEDVEGMFRRVCSAIAEGDAFLASGKPGRFTNGRDLIEAAMA